MKILVSDVDQSHGNTCKSKVETECPTADVVVRLESLSSSITWAKNNSVDIVSRSTTGLSDSRNEYEGQDAEDNGIGVVHALGSNSHVRDTNPSDLDLISAVSGGSGNTIQASYGPGLEYFNPDESTQSYSTARTAGIIAQLMIDNPTWNFHDARQALRQTAHLYSTGRIEDGGYGSQDKTAAGNVATLDLSSPIRKSFSSEDDNVNVLFSWKNNPQSDFNNTVIAMFDSEPTRDQAPGQIIYEGTAEEYNYTSNVTGNKWFAFYTRDSSNNYSKIENNADDISYWFDKVEISLTEADTTAPVVSIDNLADGSTVSGIEAISFSGDELNPEVSVDNTNWTSATDGITILNDIPQFEDIGETGFTLYFRSDDAAGNMGTTNISLTKEIPLDDPADEGDTMASFTKGLKELIKIFEGNVDFDTINLDIDFNNCPISLDFNE